MIDINAYQMKAYEGKLSKEEILAALYELKRMRAVAAYLASCHAATAETDGMLKSCSKSNRERFASICDKAADMLEHHVPAPNPTNLSTDVLISAAITRCEEAAKLLRK